MPERKSGQPATGQGFETHPRPVPGPVQGLGLVPTPGDSHALTAPDVVAIVLTLIWIALIGAFFVVLDPATQGGSGPGVLLTLVAVIVPVVLIWMAAALARTARTMRQESAQLRATLEAMRTAYVAQAQASSAVVLPAAGRTTDETPGAAPAASQPQPTFVTRRDLGAPAVRRQAQMQPAPASDDHQPALALGTPAESLVPPLATGDLIRALNFPDSPADKEGFRALRLALEDRSVAKLVRAAQDVLTLLSQDGIYMDDLSPDRARPELWRRFAQGERGRPVAALGGVRDRSSLALTAARMRSDTIFRDSAHHFLRQFDRSFAAFEKTATDQEIADLAETRTARAFMLFGRVTGIFD